MMRLFHVSYVVVFFFFFFNDTATTEIYTLSLHDALPILIGDDAKVDHVKIGSEGSRALHISTLMASLGARGELNDLSFTTGGAVVRNQIHLRYAGEDAAATIAGASLIKGRQHVDTTLVVDHA